MARLPRLYEPVAEPDAADFEVQNFLHTFRALLHTTALMQTPPKVSNRIPPAVLGSSYETKREYGCAREHESHF